MAQRVSGRSLGKGSRRLPGRDGGARRSTSGRSWRDYVPSAVGLETGLEQPCATFRFRLFEDGLPSNLAKLDAELSQRGVPFHIKSMGLKRLFHGILREARFELRTAERHEDVVRELLRELGAA